jgi:lipoprotein-releasing system permease protein
MSLELFIAKRIHFSKDADKEVTPPIVRIAIAGIALGFTVMILAVSIVIGFKKEIRNKVIGFGSHIQITNFDNNNSYEYTPIVFSDTLLAVIDSFPGVVHTQPFATKPGIIKTETDFQGIVLKGVDNSYDWSFFKKNLLEGDTISLEANKPSSDVLISKYQSDLLGLKLGDSFLTYFVQDDVRARKFTIKGIYETGFIDYDKIFVVTDLRQIQRLNKWDSDQVSGLEIFVNDYDNSAQISEDIFFRIADEHDRTGNEYYTRSIRELNPTIFDWLDVQDINVIVILILIISVAGFTMISGLLIIILERTNMIGVLKALGESNRSIRKIFLYVSLFLIGKGMIWGNVIGVSLCLTQKFLRIMKLDASVYYIDAVPIDLNVTAWLLLNAGTLIVSMLMMMLPSILVSRIDPVKSIRFE